MLNVLSAVATCFIVYAPGQVAVERALRHEMAHCWGWEDDGHIDPPSAYTMLGTYPKTVFPCGRPCKPAEALRICHGHYGCEWDH